MRRRRTLEDLPAFDPDSGELNVIVETRQGSRNKFKFDETHGVFCLSGVLPVGATFPHDFGFVPSTLGDDGDPLDVLVLMDEPAFPGCLVPSRLIGVITARQQEGSDPVEQNDRLVAVAIKSHAHAETRTLDDLGAHLLDEIEHFFVSYNEQRGRRFEPTGRKGSRAAKTLVEEGAGRFARQHAATTGSGNARSGSKPAAGRRR